MEPVVKVLFTTTIRYFTIIVKELFFITSTYFRAGGKNVSTAVVKMHFVAVSVVTDSKT
jgi:hypothetical protein